MTGMSRGGDAFDMIKTFVKYSADVSAIDNYDLSPLDRLASNAVKDGKLLLNKGATNGSCLSNGVPD